MTTQSRHHGSQRIRARRFDGLSAVYQSETDLSPKNLSFHVVRPTPSILVDLIPTKSLLPRPWFSTTLSTGAVAVVLAETSNRFHGLETIGKLFFIVDLVLFATFTCLIGIRFYYTPAKLKASLHHPEEGLFFGAYWVSVGLIIQCIQFYGIPACGPWLVKTQEVLFWLYCAVALIVAIGQYYVFFQRERLNVADAMPAWIFPIYPILLIGTLAADIIPSQPPDAGFTMFIGATMLQGLAWAVAFMMYTIYTQRLMTSSLPPPSTRPGMYVSVGPAGTTI